MQAAAPPTFNANGFRAALGRFATGVTVVAAIGDNGKPTGLTVSSFNSVSLTPPLVLWSLRLVSSSLPLFDHVSHYAINVLSSEQIDLARRFATRGIEDRFADVAWTPGANGAPVLAGCAAFFLCRPRSRYVEGDHAIYVAEVEHCEHHDIAPLVFHAGGFDLTPRSR